MRLHRVFICGLILFTAVEVCIGEPPTSPTNPPAASQPSSPPSWTSLPVIDWQDAKNHIDEEVVVQGRIVQARAIGKITFLNFDSARSFTAVIHDRNYKNFTTPAEQAYANKTIRIRGLISEFRDKPQIEIIKPDQVMIVADKTPIPPTPIAPKPHEFDGNVTIATFNVLNLFDAHDDPYYLDEGTDPKPEAELTKISAMIRQVNADVLALEEVENEGVLKQFVQTHLADMGYRNIVSYPSNDRRGIECSVVSRLPVGPVTSYRFVDFSDGSGGTMRFQRDLLRVNIMPPEAPAFDVFVVHLKSKRGGEGSSGRIRVSEAKKARDVLDGLIQADSDAKFVICGDFNDTFDSPSLKLIRGSGPKALRDFLHDVPKTTMTYNQSPYQSMIDFIFASPSMGKHYIDKSYRVFPSSKSEGGSDHNPVVVRFKLR